MNCMLIVEVMLFADMGLLLSELYSQGLKLKVPSAALLLGLV